MSADMTSAASYKVSYCYAVTPLSDATLTVLSLVLPGRACFRFTGEVILPTAGNAIAAITAAEARGGDFLRV